MKIIEQSSSLIRAELVMAEHPESFAGHFPGLPVLPGVEQLRWAVSLATDYWYPQAVFSQLSRLKFQKVVGEDDVLQLEINNRGNGKIAFSCVECSEEPAASVSSGVFQLQEFPGE